MFTFRYNKLINNNNITLLDFILIEIGFLIYNIFFLCIIHIYKIYVIRMYGHVYVLYVYNSKMDFFFSKFHLKRIVSKQRYARS